MTTAKTKRAIHETTTPSAPEILVPRLKRPST
jgi:hypothetical protein